MVRTNGKVHPVSADITTQEDELLHEFSKGIIGKPEFQSMLSHRNKYDDIHHPKLVYRLCANLGADNEQLSKILGVSLATLSSWMRTNKRFRHAIQLGKDRFNTHTIENCLLRRATGYSQRTESKTVRTKVVLDEEGVPVINCQTGDVLTYEEVQQTITDTHYPPDMKAIIFFLANRDRKRWRRNPDNENVKVTHKQTDINIGLLSEEELKQLHDITKKVEKASPGDIMDAVLTEESNG